MRRFLEQLKDLPQTAIPDPEGALPRPERLQRVEGSLAVTVGAVSTSLGVALLLDWIFLPVPPLALVFLLAAVIALSTAYGAWRSKHYHTRRCSGRASPEGKGQTAGNMYGELKEKGQLWLWGWVVVVQLLVGLSCLSIAASFL